MAEQPQSPVTRWQYALLLLAVIVVQVAVATLVSFVPMPWYGRWAVILAGLWFAILMAPRLTGRGLPTKDPSGSVANR